MKKIITLIAFGTLLLSSNLMAQAYINLGVSDADLNTDPNSKQQVTVSVTSNHGETESVVLTESGNDTSRFTGLVPVNKSNEQSGDGDGEFNINQNTNFEVKYIDAKHGEQGEKVLTASTNIDIIADDVASDIPPTATDTSGESASGGGGCSYNENAKSFDMMFLILLGLGLLYPLRKKLLSR